MMKRLTIDQFKKNIKNYTNETILKDYQSSVETDDSRVINFIISTEDSDRSNDVISQDGWDLKSYQKNPVVFFNHLTDDLPIGKCISINVVDKQLRASVEFVAPEVPLVGQKAEAVYQLLKNGFLSATSVGFKPIEYEITDDQTRGAGSYSAGIDFIRTELTEFSIVGIPCNPNALIDAPKSFVPVVEEVAEEVVEAPTNSNRAKYQRLLALAIARG